MVSVTKAMVVGMATDPDDRLRTLDLDVLVDGQVVERVETKTRKVVDAPEGVVQHFSYQFPEDLRGKMSLSNVGVKPSESEGFLPGSPCAEDLNQIPPVNYEALTEDHEADGAPPLDQADAEEAALSPAQRSWLEKGYLKVSGILEPAVLERYEQARAERCSDTTGWGSPAPYMHVPELMSLCCDAGLARLLEELVGEPMGVHLNLTGWISTERNWHQDDYLSDPKVKGWRLGVWVALQDIDPRSGPFQFVPGSHRWPVMRREKVRGLLPSNHQSRADWPTLTQDRVSEACEEEIARRGAMVETFIAKKGDLLIWHPRLLHRGSTPKRPGIERRSVILHYSSIHRRPDFKPAEQAPEGGWYFPNSLPLF